MDVKKEYQGHLAAVDSYSGHLYIDPDEDTLNRLKEKKRREEEKRKGLSYLIGKKAVQSMEENWIFLRILQNLWISNRYCAVMLPELV